MPVPIPSNFKFSTVPCVEVHGTQREWYDTRNGQLNAMVVLECDYDLRWDLISDLLRSRVVSDQAPNVGQNDLENPDFANQDGYRPRAWPYPVDNPQAGVTGLGCVSANITYLPEKYSTDGISGQTINYQKANIRAQFSTFWDINDTMSFDGEILKVDHIYLRWKNSLGGNNDPGSKLLGVTEAPVQPFVWGTLTRTFRGLPPQEVATLWDSVNKVNAHQYTSFPLIGEGGSPQGYTFEAETLLMLDPVVRPTTCLGAKFIKTDDQRIFGEGSDVTVRFLYKQQGHNSFWRPNYDRDNNNEGVPTGVSQVAGRWDRLEAIIPDPQGGPTTYKPYEPFESKDFRTTWLVRSGRPQLLLQ